EDQVAAERHVDLDARDLAVGLLHETRQQDVDAEAGAAWRARVDLNGVCFPLSCAASGRARMRLPCSATWLPVCRSITSHVRSRGGAGVTVPRLSHGST